MANSVYRIDIRYIDKTIIVSYYISVDNKTEDGVRIWKTFVDSKIEEIIGHLKEFYRQYNLTGDVPKIDSSITWINLEDRVFDDISFPAYEWQIYNYKNRELEKYYDELLKDPNADHNGIYLVECINKAGLVAIAFCIKVNLTTIEGEKFYHNVVKEKRLKEERQFYELYGTDLDIAKTECRFLCRADMAEEYFAKNISYKFLYRNCIGLSNGEKNLYSEPEEKIIKLKKDLTFNFNNGDELI